MSAAQFLDALFGDCDTGLAEVRGYPSGMRCWLPLGDWRALPPFLDARTHAHDNVAVGISTRRDSSSGAASNLLQLPAAFADLDLRPAEASHRLANFGFVPHIVVESGLGLHPYWRFKEPLDVSDTRGCDYASSLLRRLAHVLDGDARATDPARILRVPGTFNWKYDRPRPVVLVSTRPGAIDVDELDDFLPRETPASKASLSEGTIPQGMRNDWLFRLGRSLRARQLPANTIVGTLETLNATRCRPPLPGEELKYLLHQVFTLPHRPDFHPPRPHGCHGLAGREPGKPEGTRP